MSINGKLGRNDPCHCGSGNKYKKCCLSKDEALAAQANASDQAFGRAFQWLSEHYESAVDETLADDYFDGYFPEEFDGLPDPLLDSIEINSIEWLLAEGMISPGENEPLALVMGLILGADGPTWSAEERHYLELLGSTSLGLYEVLEVTPGIGFRVVSTIEDEPERFWVQDQDLSTEVSTGDLFAGRVLPLEPRALSGALYMFGRHDFERLLARIPEEPREDGKIPREWISTCVITTWLDAITDEGLDDDPDPLALIVYKVNDWPSVEQALNGNEGVETASGRRWLHKGDPLCAMEQPDEDRLLLTAHTMAADAAIHWFATLVGDAVTLIGREVEPMNIDDNQEDDDEES